MGKKEAQKVKIEKENLDALNELSKAFENWIENNRDTAKKFDMSRKIAGFLGEALVFQRLKKHSGRIKAIWKGGTHKGYDIEVGTATPITISVRTASDACHKNNKHGDEYQWSFGWNDEDGANNPNLFYVCVDLRNLEKPPDFYVVPSRVIKRHFKQGRKENGGPKKWPWPRWHPKFKEIKKYKRWSPLWKRIG